MLLSAFLGSNFISCCIFDTQKQQFSKEKFIKIPFSADNLHPILTLKKLDALLSSYTEEERNYKRIISSSYCQPLDIKIDYSINDLIEKTSLPILAVDSGCITDVSYLSEKEAAQFLNLRRYHQMIPYATRKKLDAYEISNQTPKLAGVLIGKDQIIVETYDIDKRSVNEYAAFCVKAFSDACLITGNWQFFFDFDYSLVCKLAAFVESGLNISGLFESLQPTAALIIAPDVEEMNVIDDMGKKTSEKIKLEKDSFTQIKLKSEEIKNVEWKSKKSKFKGKIYGSKTGVLVDTKDRNARQKG